MYEVRIERRGVQFTPGVEEKMDSIVLATDEQYAKWGPPGEGDVCFVKDLGRDAKKRKK